MTKYLLTVGFGGSVTDVGMTGWTPAEIRAHLDYHAAVNDQLRASGELLETLALTGPERAKVVTAGAGTEPTVRDGPFAGSTEMLAGYQLVDVESEERALEIAAQVSRVPGPGGVPLQQPVGVRRVMDAADVEMLIPDA
ncbi:YciI family protein [Jidongwangia harbinensis]|uniref:YciI family protein n=1 Tax=Jidongwangia harbinensis TaxID=2878561 RepID=UPI001CD9FDA0|nr:YciI family protein [Jidongwangia harbinensis]MCA2212605.1 YciI family protein [Jidongwangia harbinensis]